MSPQMISPTPNGLYVCRDLEAISPLGTGMLSRVPGALKLLTSRHGVTLSIYKICHTNTVIFFSYVI